MNKKVVYIAGPMRGIKWFNFPAFDMARDELKEQGFEVVSPADLDREIGFDPWDVEDPDEYDWMDLETVGFSIRDAIKRDIDALRDRCSHIYMLDGWEDSKGARAEKAMAEWMGLEVMFQSIPERLHPNRLKDMVRQEYCLPPYHVISPELRCTDWEVNQNVFFAGYEIA